MKLKTEAFIQAIRDQSLGFLLGNPWRFTEQSLTCVVPVLRSLDEEPGYIVLSKTKNIEIIDTGSINRIKITNNENLPVYIRTGEVFKGSTQERASVRSFIVMPKETLEIDVNCIHHFKGIIGGTKFRSGGYVPERDSLYLNNMYKGNKSFNFQSLSWSADNEYTTKVKKCTSHAFFTARASSPDLESIKTIQSDDIVRTRDEVNKVLNDVLKKVPLFDNQIGIILIDKDGFHSLDCYDLHSSWKDVKEAIIGKESISITSDIDDEGVFQYKPEKAHLSIKAILEKGFEKKIIHDSGYEVIGIKYNKYVGEVVLLDGNVIHLLITRS